MTSKRTVGALGAVVVVGLLAGCAGGSTDAGQAETVTESDFDEAMSTPTTLTYWTWVPDIQNQVDMFEEAYPEIDVKVENVGQGAPHYAKVRSALEAGQGAPDVAQIEYQYIPSFVVTESLLDLAPYGAADLAPDYVEWVWAQVSKGEAVYAIPQDIGPLGNLYRADILAEAGIDEAPATWEEYADAARKVKDETGSYISNVASGEPSQFIGMLWQAGAKPFAFDGVDTVSIDVNSEAAKEVAAYWQELVQDDLISTDPGFTDAWYQGMASGKYAGWLTAAWAPIFLEGAAESTAGAWTAAPLPQWDAAAPSSGNWGGSSNAVLAGSENPIAAAELAKFINNDRASTLALATEQNFFPATVATLEDPQFADQESAFFGGQKVNAVFAEIATTVDTDFEWLPFNDYVYETYTTIVGKALADKGDLVAALDEWQDVLVTYAEDQGFTVE